MKTRLNRPRTTLPSRKFATARQKTAATRPKTTSLRITSGTLRGRVLKSPGSAKTHPMGDREKLALFNRIGPWLPGARVLDLYAGSGALGLEALSRGAKTAIFVDHDPKSIATIKANISTLDLEPTTRVVKGEVDTIIARHASKTPVGPSGLPRPKGRSATGVLALLLALPGSALSSNNDVNPAFDVIFCDPPYDAFEPEAFANIADLLSEDGIFVLSHPDEAPELPNLSLKSTATYAAAHLSFYEKTTPVATPQP